MASESPEVFLNSDVQTTTVWVLQITVQVVMVFQQITVS